MAAVLTIQPHIVPGDAQEIIQVMMMLIEEQQESITLFRSAPWLTRVLFRRAKQLAVR